jgi:hypothetical protein
VRKLGSVYQIICGRTYMAYDTALNLIANGLLLVLHRLLHRSCL